jgi:hypothetical protein
LVLFGLQVKHPMRHHGSCITFLHVTNGIRVSLTRDQYMYFCIMFSVLMVWMADRAGVYSRGPTPAPTQPNLFNPQDVDPRLAELVVPAAHAPGAKAAETHSAMMASAAPKASLLCILLDVCPVLRA